MRHFDLISFIIGCVVGSSGLTILSAILDWLQNL